MDTSYRDDPAFAQSDLKLFAQNRRLFYETKILRLWDNDRRTPSKEFGTLVDHWLFAPQRLLDVPAEVLSKSGSRAGKAWQHFVKENPDRTYVMPEQRVILDAMLESLKRHERVTRILFGDHEMHSYVRRKWDCPHTGLERKCELDAWLPEQGFILDVKTCVDPTPVAFAEQVAKWGYHIQGATYCEGQGVYEEVNAYLLIAIRNEPPYDVELYELAAEWLAEGERWNERWMRRLASDLSESRWDPVTKDHTVILSRPRGYAQYAWDDSRLCGDQYDGDAS